jgi:hypothetical protein
LRHLMVSQGHKGGMADYFLMWIREETTIHALTSGCKGH